MQKRIIEPPKLYVDTNHLIEIAKFRCGEKLTNEKLRGAYACIDSWLQTAVAGIIFNPGAPLEWVDGNATQESANRIAAVIDSAKLQYEMEMSKFVWVQEVLQECRRQKPCLHVPTLPIMHLRVAGSSAGRALAIMMEEVPGYFEKGDLPADFPQKLGVVPFRPARDHVAEAFRFKRQKPDVYNERVEGYKAALSPGIEQAKRLKHVKKKEVDAIEWMKRYLRIDVILSALNPDWDVDAVVRAVEVWRCPATDLFLKARDKRMRAGHPPDDNEGDDWAFLAVVPYADVVLTDRGFRESLLRADSSLGSKVIADPKEAVRILKH